MKKILLTIIAFLILPQVSFGAVTYSRTPSGASVTSPITITVTVDAITDLGADFAINDFWGVVIDDGGVFYPDCYTVTPITTLSLTQEIVVPAGEYVGVLAIGYSDAFCGGTQGNAYNYLEGDSNTTIFTVIASSVLFGGTTSSDLMASVGSVSSNVYLSVLPYFLLSIGVFVGFMIVQKLVDMLGLAYDRRTGREPRATKKRGRKKKD